MGMTRLDMGKCHSCAWYFSYDKEDIEVVAHGMRYRVFCPNCKSEYRIDPSIFHDLYPNGRPGELEEKVVKPKPDTHNKDFHEALAAQEALHEHRTQAKAAKALDITVAELRRRLKNLPVEAEV